MASVTESLNRYFSLYGVAPVAGKDGSAETRRQVVLYIGVALGAFCKVIYDTITAAGSHGLGAFIVALIVSVVVFPQLYYSGGLNRRKLSFAHWTFAFQNGFFWNVAFAALVKHTGLG